VLRDIEISNLSNVTSMAIRNAPNAGELFMESVCAGRMSFNNPGQKIWARQLDPEARDVTKIVNNGCQLWILGLKTERPGTIVDSSNGAVTEIIGGLFHPVVKAGDDAILKVNNSRLSASYVTVASNVMPDFSTHLMETRGDQTQYLHQSDLYPRPAFAGARASLVPLMVASPEK
jgi:hypothetical protein